ncbi:glutamate synthase large subunit [Psychroflexus salis]|uniref:Glutamate synthase large subunit n=1 Tax=Psychroflexus salis TaxID=1526574 RepID=A0A917E6G4_9FLAO|nr:glutamate synthase large subunit [Psychroflexus salis]GGE07777.1 glutamate synthase large subunit [Psychroflexus salis]
MQDLIHGFKDSCGCGIIANIDGKPDAQIKDDALTALGRMMHRGAIAADGKSGDGCGILTAMPHEFMKNIALANGFSLPKKYAVGSIFFTNQNQKTVFENALGKYDLKLLFYRDVPIDKSFLGDQALKCIPDLKHAFIIPNAPVAEQRFEEFLYLCRKQTENNLPKDKDFYIASLSPYVISYKGLVKPDLLKDFYLDLQGDEFKTGFALFHQRFSTNTLPRWSLAQPFRTLAHNGEINAINGNRFNVKINTEKVESNVYSAKELKEIGEILDQDASDSGSVDNMFEYLLANGVNFFKAMSSMFPPAWQNLPKQDAKIRAYYEYLTANFEAWDGPAALNFTDGRYLATAMDRNGLRPAKYIITKDNRFLIASELGVIDIDEENVKYQGKLHGGEAIAVDTKHGKVLMNEEIRDYLKNSQPYGEWLAKHQHYLAEHYDENFVDFSDYQLNDALVYQRYFNYTHETVEQIIAPMLQNGKEEIGSMGDDTPLACFSQVQRNFTDFFRQKFAQVTNPAVDPLREKLIMSLSVTLGPRGNILKEVPENATGLRLNSPVLSKEKLDIIKNFGNPNHSNYKSAYKYKSFSTSFEQNLHQSLFNIAFQIKKAIEEDNISMVILDDRCLSNSQKIIPIPLMVGFVNNYLSKHQLRSKVSIIVCSGELYDSHSCAVVIGFGATAVYPYLLYGTALTIAERNKKAKNHNLKLVQKKALQNIHHALNAGLLKIMSKMGICAIDSYQHSGLFDIIGLSKEITDECFSNAHTFLAGLTYKDIEMRIDQDHAKTFQLNEFSNQYELEVGSFYKYMPKGEYHDYAPAVSMGIRRFAASLNKDEYDAVQNRINQRGFRMIRDFYNLNSTKKSISVEEVEPIEDITWRFNSAAMSLGAISPEAHEALAEAMNQIGAMSNSGEGGEDRKRFNTIKNSKIKQVASGRFGVTPQYLRSAEEIQIKLAQGAKPGEGGQLPGKKVTPLIANLRHTMPGVTLISPPPHHDIYSIEDLAQLIYDLKQINPKARVSVKLVSSSGVGTIAVGVAKAYADKIIISGCDGGTGAAQLASIKFAGNPWELGLIEAHNALKVNDLRKSIELQTDGGLKTGLDVVKAAIMGAETFGFGTVLLNTVGCKILRVCHLNKCSVGIATQNETLREHYTGTVEAIVQYLQHIAQDIREILAKLGYTSLDDVIGKTELLDVVENEIADKFDFKSILFDYKGENIQRIKHNDPFDKNTFEKEIFKEVKFFIEKPKNSKSLSLEINNTNRSFGTYTSGFIAEKYGDVGLPKDSLIYYIKGNAGQSFGAFLSQGMSLYLTGNANDYVGKGMRGGRIVIRPKDTNKQMSIAGNTCLYGATGGKLFITGSVGERFAVRNSGALAVVEGTGDHACEYMTGGTVVILGKTGYNFGAGMTGGAAFVYDKDLSFFDKVNMELVKLERIDTEETEEARHYLKKILRSYIYRTQSETAKKLLTHFLAELRFFWLVTPKDMKAPLNPFEGN